MKCLRKGNKDLSQKFYALCNMCNAEIMAERKELRIERNFSYTSNALYEFAKSDCPECNGYQALTFYDENVNEYFTR